MKKCIRIFPIIMMVAVILLIIGCVKEEQKTPILSTSAITNITQQSAVSGGNVTSAGASEIIERGICWSTNPSPTINDKQNIDIGKTTGSFIGKIYELKQNTTYYVRAYATNSNGITYGQEVTFTTSDKPTDFDGNIYDTVKIGAQVWFKQNLKTIHYANGDPIENVQVDSIWNKITTGAYKSCSQISDYSTIYGHLYNYFAVADPRKICPDGWHVSTNDDWTTLTNFAGGDYSAGGKLKERDTLHWKSPNTGATDEYGFSALPGGAGCSRLNVLGMFWSPTYKVQTPDLITYRLTSYVENRLITSWTSKNDGLSVRCIKD